MQREIKWTAGSGQQITITLEAVYALDMQGRRKSSGKMEVSYAATVDGKPHDVIGGLQSVDHHTLVARLGQIGLNAENHAKVQAATDELEASFAEHNAACYRHADELDAVDMERERIERAMR